MAAPAFKTGSLVQLRTIAVKILAQVLNSELSIDDAMLAELNRTSGATKPEFDRSWIYEMCSGVLRYKGRLDFIIDTYSLKKKPTGPLRRYLYTAVYQILAQETVPALVVSETVQAVREKEGEAPAKFVNACLRKVADAKEQWKNWSVTAATAEDELIAWCSLPKWIYKKLVKQYGLEFTLAYSKASLERPVTWFKNLENGESQILPHGYQGNEARGFVQDISNQNLVKKVHENLLSFGQSKNSKSLPKVLDLCSAPGGKALALAGLQYSVVATDRDEQRLLKVVENKTRLKFQDSALMVKPFIEVWGSAQKWDVIWLDVPCMSIGIMRRHPEIKWNRLEKDLPLLVLKQEELVEWSRAHLEPEGILVYSTCSLFKEENPEKIQGFELCASFKAFPQEEPFGDGIVAHLFKLA